ncbi:MAG TPA: RsmD family RNA methyltransferase, partial [Acidimicrobiales bacterium]|nr:RsmD family RNA methyltransferase [Acidimicrobiales bacterium]
MRVVAGEARGRRLVAPPGRATRPTSDRVRESIFDILTSLDAVEGATVADLFAGSGAMGIEALSRGASRAAFVDSDPGAIQAVKANLDTTGTADRATVVRSDVLRWLPSAPPVDLALVDPPYTFDAWPELLTGLHAGLAILESDRELEVPEGW